MCSTKCWFYTGAVFSKTDLKDENNNFKYSLFRLPKTVITFVWMLYITCYSACVPWNTWYMLFNSRSFHLTNSIDWSAWWYTVSGFLSLSNFHYFTPNGGLNFSQYKPSCFLYTSSWLQSFPYRNLISPCLTFFT